MAITPTISVILLVGRRRKRSARALNSVLQQEGAEMAEVLLVDTAPEEPALIGSDHACVQLEQVYERGTYGAMRADAVRRARAPIVVFIEDHCVACPGWFRAIEAAFEDPWAAVGPRMLNANAGIGVSDAIHFINYGLWTDGSGRGPVGLIAGHNSAYRREVLLGLGSELDSLLLSDTLLQWRLAKHGHQFLYEPAACIGHLYPTSLAIALRDVFFFHRCFGALR
ncbi:MAG: glycosyltransferase, partial [Anaerolineales bacterium]